MAGCSNAISGKHALALGIRLRGLSPEPRGWIAWWCVGSIHQGQTWSLFIASRSTSRDRPASRLSEDRRRRRIDDEQRVFTLDDCRTAVDGGGPPACAGTVHGSDNGGDTTKCSCAAAAGDEVSCIGARRSCELSAGTPRSYGDERWHCHRWATDTVGWKRHSISQVQRRCRRQIRQRDLSAVGGRWWRGQAERSAQPEGDSSSAAGEAERPGQGSNPADV